MANGLIEENTIQSIANAIRLKNGNTSLYKPASMPQAIEDIALGVDTSDATAGEYSISKGKTAYSKGSKITGTIEDINLSYPTVKPTSSTYNTHLIDADLSTYGTDKKINLTYVPDTNVGQDGIILRPNTTFNQPIENIIGLESLSAENIKSGVSIAGIIGTYETDLSACEAIASNILGGA